MPLGCDHVAIIPAHFLHATAHHLRLHLRLSLCCAAVGTINKVGVDYIGLLLLGFINVSLAADQIRSEFQARPLVRHWWGGGVREA